MKGIAEDNITCSKFFAQQVYFYYVLLGLNSGQVSSQHPAFFFLRNKHATSAYSPSKWFYKFVLIECMLSGHIFFGFLPIERSTAVLACTSLRIPSCERTAA